MRRGLSQEEMQTILDRARRTRETPGSTSVGALWDAINAFETETGKTVSDLEETQMQGMLADRHADENRSR